MSATAQDRSERGRRPDPATHLYRLNVAVANFALAVRAELDVGAKGYLAIQYLVAAESEIGLKDLGELLGVTSSACTLLVNRLERAGHLRRVRHRFDRRRTNVVVSESTRRIVEAANGSVFGVVDGVMRGMPPRDRAVVERFLDVVARSYDVATSSRGQRLDRDERPGDAEDIADG